MQKREGDKDRGGDKRESMERRSSKQAEGLGR
jgi:hypothetical protein